MSIKVGVTHFALGGQDAVEPSGSAQPGNGFAVPELPDDCSVPVGTQP